MGLTTVILQPGPTTTGDGEDVQGDKSGQHRQSFEQWTKRTSQPQNNMSHFSSASATTSSSSATTDTATVAASTVTVTASTATAATDTASTATAAASSLLRNQHFWTLVADC
ncbi:uncharacterized protein LOC120353964 [Nilaparvata lugens]|uniref:uncharacterized protein LOC120353964 n=1 Tax=Nilaparvata lugens TaxID=108931 RepID=UPI00193D2535|nr:uncharacterized protein LOC120353964 [Nilaparvata lugens]